MYLWCVPCRKVFAFNVTECTNQTDLHHIFTPLFFLTQFFLYTEYYFLSSNSSLNFHKNYIGEVNTGTINYIIISTHHHLCLQGGSTYKGTRCESSPMDSRNPPLSWNRCLMSSRLSTSVLKIPTKINGEDLTPFFIWKLFTIEPFFAFPLHLTKASQ